MLLKNLIKDIPIKNKKINVKGLAINSKKIKKGYIFFAIKGLKSNGEKYIAEAVKKGASVIICSRKCKYKNEKIPIIKTSNIRNYLSKIASKFFQLKPKNIIAVTGTNGKTSVCEYLHQIWSRATWPSAAIGTLGVNSNIETPNKAQALLTTPPSEQLFALLDSLRKGGVTHAAFEASSHGLDQMRLHKLPVNVAVFTNLSHDHLDWHGDMNSYFEAKTKLFTENLLDGGTAVINIDDEWGRKLYERLKNRDIVLWSVGIQDGANFQILKAESQHFGLDLQIKAAGQDFRYPLALSGEFQAINTVTAAAAAYASGMPLQDSFGTLPYLTPVRGRMQPIHGHPTGARVIVDFAHTPDALEGALKALRSGTNGQLKLVFGCGGDRDKAKRSEMGKIAANFADKVIVTDDNPRSEDPVKIRKAILDSCPAASEIAPRDKAIQQAIAGLNEGDTLLVAGKGHETVQTVGSEILPFDDASVARHALMNLADNDSIRGGK